MSYSEPPGEDHYDLHVADAELLLDMTEEDVKGAAVGMNMTVGEYRQWRDWRIGEYRSVNPDDLTPDQYRRLFRSEPELR